MASRYCRALPAHPGVASPRRAPSPGFATDGELHESAIALPIPMRTTTKGDRRRVLRWGWRKSGDILNDVVLRGLANETKAKVPGLADMNISAARRKVAK